MAGTFMFHTFIGNSNYSTFTVDYIEDEMVNSDANHTTTELEIEKDTSVFIKKGGIHSATWYNPHGARTASGLRFHKDSLTCAYNFTKMHSILKVTNPITNQSVYVKVTDRMGNKSSNHIDLSKCAFDSIGNPSSGRIKVIVEEVITQ
jgi:rare lipoprotein A (peptidoglycan hydrolase)